MKQHTTEIQSASLLAISREYFDLKRTLDPILSEAKPVAIPMSQPAPKRKLMNAYRQFAKTLLLATGLSAVLAVPVFAAPGCDAMEGRARHAEHHEKMMEQHHKQLHVALKLTAEQEPGWNALMAAEQTKMPGMGRGDREDWSKLSTPERAEKMLAHQAERQTRMTAYVAALKDFYATLSADQKKTFEALHASQRGKMRGKGGPRNSPAMSSPAKE